MECAGEQSFEGGDDPGEISRESAAGNLTRFEDSSGGNHGEFGTFDGYAEGGQGGP